MALLLCRILISGIAQSMNFILLRRQLGYSYKRRLQAKLGVIFLAILTAALYYNQAYIYINTVGLLLFYLIYAVIAFDSRIEMKIFWGCTSYLVTLISDSFAKGIALLGAAEFSIFRDNYFTAVLYALVVVAIYFPFIRMSRNRIEIPYRLRIQVIIMVFVYVVAGTSLAWLSLTLGREYPEQLFVYVIDVTLLAIVYGSIYVIGKFGEITFRNMEEHDRRKREELFDALSSFRHDFVNHFTTVGLAIQSENYAKAYDYIQSLNIRLESLNSFVNTGNSTLDAILANKAATARRNGIMMDVVANWHDDAELSDMDIITIFGNLLDNAVEACISMPAGSKPYISVRVAPVNETLRINITNSSPGKYNVSGKSITTTKTESGHGIGLKNVRNVCSEIGGHMSIEPGRDEFSVLISIPIMGDYIADVYEQGK